MKNTHMPFRHLPTIVFAAGLLVLAVPSHAQAQANGRFDIIVISGQSSPSSIVGSGPFSDFEVPFLNDAGQVAFRGSFTSGGTITGIYLGSAAGVSNIGVQGTPAPGGGIFTSFSLPSLNEAGQVVFSGSTSGGVGAGLFESTASGLSALALQGGTNPGGGTFSGGTFATGTIWRVNDSGQVVFGAGGTLDVASPGTLVNFTKAGASAPGGGTFTVIQAPSYNNSGLMAFGANISSGTSYGMFLGTTANLTKVASTGASAPGGGTFSGFDNPLQAPALNTAGQIAYYGETTGAGSPGKGLYLSNSTATSSIVLAGASAPGGGVFSDFNVPSINNSGNVAFGATTIGGAGSGLYVTTATGVKRIAAQGGSAPGGGTFGSFSANHFAGQQVSFNNSGVAAFAAFNQSNTNIYLGDGTDLLRAAAAGDVIGGMVASSVSLAPASGSQDSGQSALNDFGQVAFKATFSGGKSGIFIYTPTLHWRASGAGAWDNRGNWTLGLAPGAVHDVLIDSSSALAVTGPTTSTSLRSLQVGGGTAAAELKLNINGSISATAGLNIAANGTLSGNGSMIGDVTNSGLLSPGETFGSIAVTGNLLETGTGVLKMEIGGLVRGTGYDTIAITGTMSLGGVLNVTLADGFLPGAGQTFDLFDWNNASGSFNQVNLPSLGSGLSWDTNQLATNGSIQVVPEPGAAGLICVAGCLLLVRRRRL